MCNDQIDGGTHEATSEQWSSTPSTVQVAHYEWSNTSPCEAVIKTIAAVVGADPLDIEPLYSKVDPDALNQLFLSIGGGEVKDNVAVSFHLHGYAIAVYSEGRVEVQPLDDEARG